MNNFSPAAVAYRMYRDSVRQYRHNLRCASDDWERGRYAGHSETYWNTLYWSAVRMAWNARAALNKATGSSPKHHGEPNE